MGETQLFDLAAQLFVRAFSVLAPNYVYILFKIFCNHVRLVIYTGVIVVIMMQYTIVNCIKIENMT